MKRRSVRPEDAFQAALEGGTADATPEIHLLSKLASALEPAARGGVDPRFRARLRNQLLAEASHEEDVFAAILDGEPVDAPAEMLVLAKVASALEPAARPLPSPEFRYGLRNRLITEARPRRGGLAALNARMRRSLRAVTAFGMAAVMMLGLSGSYLMAQNDAPGDGLYGWKLMGERAQLLVASGPAKGYLMLGFSRTRVEEIHTLVDRAETDHTLYVDALNRSDTFALEGAEILITAFREGKAPEAMDRVIAFAEVQSRDLESLVERIPPAARPVARDSIATVDAVRDRAEEVRCGCNPEAPPNPLVESPPQATSPGEDATQPVVTCACQPAPPPSDTSDGTGGGDRGSDRPRGDDDGTPPDDDPGPPPDDDPTVDAPDVPGTDADDQVEDAVNDLIDEIVDDLPPAPTGIPTPLP